MRGIGGKEDISDDVIRYIKVCYRSSGIGAFGVVMRWAGMPLEKIALFMNSSQVKGPNPFRQSVQLTFQDGIIAPYKVVKAPSIVAWFFQYSVMGLAFQVFDQSLSNALGVRPMYYGSEIMEPPEHDENGYSTEDTFKVILKTTLAPILSGSIESCIANRAEVQRYYGPNKFMALEKKLNWTLPARAVGPAFLSNASRNIIMCGTTFVFTPLAYKLYYPQELKSPSSLFWFGLSTNIFVGNVVAITQQALWGRSLDHLYTAATSTANTKMNGISYVSVIKSGVQTEGRKAFFTTGKWSSRVLMNAPAQGTLPWFYNDILPLYEDSVVSFFTKNDIFNSLVTNSTSDNENITSTTNQY
jgi:hypothetical protein